MTYRWISYDVENLHTCIIQNLISGTLSESYNIFTLRYFLYSWPHLCHMVFNISSGKCSPELVGIVIGRLSHRKDGRIRGYIAIIVVEKKHRGKGLGKELISRIITSMKNENVDEITLEVETTNLNAVNMYRKLGFMKDKLLPKYYCNFSDAYRLKLYAGNKNVQDETHE